MSLTDVASRFSKTKSEGSSACVMTSVCALPDELLADDSQAHGLSPKHLSKLEPS